MKFEYDLHKSQLNLKKHGVSLEEAKSLWFIPCIEIKARTLDEPRWMRIGELNGKFYSCIFTVRKEVIRLISVRRSRDEEVMIYRKEIEKNDKAKQED